MGKRVAVVLSGCGPADGSEVREAVLTMLSLERAGAQVICTAPDVEQPLVVDHRTGAGQVGASPRNALAESARIARGKIKPLADLALTDFDALVFPGGLGVGSVLSNYNEKGERCEVLPDIARLLKGALGRHQPIGLVCLAPILAARVLGPVAGVHLTLGPRGTTAAKHAAVMGADVRPCPANDIFVDRRNRVVSTPGYMYDEIRLPELGHAIEKMVRAVLQLARGEARPAVAPRAESAGPRSQAPGARAQGDVRDPGRGGAAASAPTVLRRPGGSPGARPR